MNTSTSFLDLPEEEFVQKLKTVSAWKERSERTVRDIHWPELKNRTGADLEVIQCYNTSEQNSDIQDDTFASKPDFSNKSDIEVVYLGNSMLERLKTTGASTELARFSKEDVAWNAGCGGDKNENVLHRLICGENSMCRALKKFNNVKLWVIVSGTNNLRKKPFRSSDLESFRLLLQACLWIAPTSKIIACDMFYRKDIPDSVVDESNNMMESVVKEVNQSLSGREGVHEIQWVEARISIGKEFLEDHVHLTEEGYKRLDTILWPWIQRTLGSTKDDEPYADEEKRGNEYNV